METISLYEAIRQMRQLTAENKYFSFVHATFNIKTQSTDGIREVRRAQLRPAAKGDEIKHAEFKLFYYDCQFHENRVCWQPLLMFFDGKKVILQ